jgi:hypothetical protein
VRDEKLCLYETGQSKNVKLAGGWMDGWMDGWEVKIKL